MPSRLDNSSKIPVLAGKNSSLSRQSPRSPSSLAPSTPSPSTANTKPPGAATRRNDVATLADKYNKCVSVIVVDRSPAADKVSSPDGKSSSTVGKSSTPGGNTTKRIAAKLEGVNTANSLKSRNGLNEKIPRVGIQKEKELPQSSKENGRSAELTQGGNDGKGKMGKDEKKEVNGKKSVQNVERTRSGLQRQKSQGIHSNNRNTIR